MELVPYIVAYIALGVFLVACVARFLMWSRMPMHLRWELYPVAHEPGRKAKYGGSYYEELNWWQKPRETSPLGEVKAMVPEILFLVALKEHNPKLWLRSFPFHFGIYLVIGGTLLMMFTGLLGALFPSAVAGGFGSLLRYLILACSVAGLALGIVGALGLLHSRLTDNDLKDFTTPADLFNLAFFVVAFGVALLSFLLVDRDLTRTMGFIYGMVTFSMPPLPGAGLEHYLPMASVVLLGVLLAYIPMTHMSHFVGKFFSYHAIRWNDAPNLAGGKEEKKIGEVLQYPVSWGAPHIKGDGQKTWADLATDNPFAEEKKQ
jgi:nitrate reductase gamma subunit